MSLDRRKIGAQYEALAAQFLTKQKLTILERNYHCKLGEVDLICTHDDTLVFVEVRARSHSKFGLPEESINRAKQRRIVRAAQHYLVQNPTNRPIRFDVVAIDESAAEKIRYYPDAFWATASY